jgi:hypothetical protein
MHLRCQLGVGSVPDDGAAVHAMTVVQGPCQMEVVHGGANHLRIDGNDGVAGSM